MSLILLLSILIRIIAMIWSITLMHRLQDKRMGFLTLMLALMASRQIFTLLQHYEGFFLSLTHHREEIFGLIVSILALIIVISFQKIIIEQKSKDKILDKNKERLKLVLEGSQDGHWDWDIPTDHEWWSAKYYELLGYKDGEIESNYQNFLGFLHPDDKDKITTAIKEHLENKKPYDVEFRLQKKSGEYDWFRGRGQAIWNEHGEPIRMSGSIQDISERKKAEEELLFTQFAIDNVSDAAFWIGENGAFVYVNNAACKSLDYTKEELLNMHVYDIDPGFKKEKWDAYWKSTEKNYQQNFEATHRKKDGSIFPVEISTNRLTYQGKKYRCTFARDISERKQAELTIQNSEERFRALYDNNPSMFFTLNQDLEITSVNKFGAEHLGYTASELIGKMVFELVCEEDRANASTFFDTCLSEPEKIHRWELRKVHKNGVIIWVREIVRVVNDNEGNTSVFIVCEDFSETHLLSEQLSYQASHDSLTGLINRPEFEIRLTRVIETARAYQSEHALCYLDLDQFKVINDACGHIAGDQLLRDISQVLQKRIRKRDTLARLGGDEFGILMEHCNLEQAEIVANQILQEVQEHRFEWDGQIYNVGVSIGLVSIHENINAHTEILREADAACYAAKDAGRNRVHIYNTDDIDMARRHGDIRWVSRIISALENDSFVLYMQPIVSTDRHESTLKHYEVLIRLKEDDNQNVIPPGAFLPAAESYNLATRIDEWVVMETFRFLNEHSDLNSKIDLISINLSGKSVTDDAFISFIIKQLEQSKNIASKICFEITETAVIANLLRAKLFIRRLKEMGCQFSLDDFGSGLSSFAYLKTLPVDYLKIDGLFVKDIVDDETDFAMVKSINDLGNIMGIKTIAEFVENDMIKNKLIDIGVDYVQGYGIGRPEPMLNLIEDSKLIDKIGKQNQ
jgi:diguanylate cyclase (GGDEF)-like protein/PAS domain S-box-containing protein